MVKKNVQVVKTGNTNELFEQMMYIGEGDVAIGISFPRYSMRTLKAMEFANNRQARVISITDSVHSPMNMYSSCNLFARSDMASIVDSLVAPMSLINALIVSICLKNSEQVVENIEKINAFVDNFEYSGNDEINMLDENVVNELKNAWIMQLLMKKSKESDNEQCYNNWRWCSRMMAAITAARNNNKVTLIEKNEKLGKKLLLQEKADVILPMPGMKKIYLTA